MQVVGEDANSQNGDGAVTDSTSGQTDPATDSDPGTDTVQSTTEDEEPSGTNSDAGIVGLISDLSILEIAAIVIIFLLSLLLLVQIRR